MSFTLGQALEMMAQEAAPPLSAEAITTLKASFSATEVSTFEGYTIPQMVQFLGSGVTMDKTPSTAASPATARALLAYLRDNEFIGQPTAAPTQAPVFPPSIKLERDKTYAEMSLRELLEALRDNPDNYEEILDALRQQPLIAKIERDRGGVSWAVPNVEGDKLDVEATIEYLRFLKNPAATPQESFRGRIPRLLDLLLGRKAVTVFHPVTAKPSAMLDENGHDLSGIHPDLWKGCLFAQRTGYKAWHGVDPYVMTEELVDLSGKLPSSGRLLRVYNAYQQAVRDERPEALGIVINVPEGQQRQHTGSTQRDGGGVHVTIVQTSAPTQLQLSEEQCRERLYAAAGAPVGTHNRGASLGREIVEHAKSHNGDFTFDRTILLEGGYTHNGHLNGVVFVPRRYEVATHNGRTNGLRVERKSYTQLYEIATSTSEYGIS